jgi:hypothetical protein
MKNVTVTLPEELARKARIEAAKADKSLSRFIADLLAERCDDSGQATPASHRAMASIEAFLSGPGHPGISKAWKGRETLYAEREDELLHRYDASRLRRRSGKSGKAAGRSGFAEGGGKGRYAGSKRSKPK